MLRYMLHTKKRKIKKAVTTTLICLGVLLVVALGVKLGIDIYREYTKPVRILKEEEIMIGNGLTLLQTGTYTGKFIEDGSDDEVEDVMFILVKNNTSSDLQYADITVYKDDEEFTFTASNIPSSGSVMLLEKNRKQAEKKITSAKSENVVFFKKEMNLQRSLFKLQKLDGAINLINISGKDITEDIYLYYKSTVDGHYMGGITYLAKVSGGVKADGVKQLSTEHFKNGNSEIVNIVLVTGTQAEQ